jgi:phage gp36-like protein
MKKFARFLLLVLLLSAGLAAGEKIIYPGGRAAGSEGGAMGYCTLADLQSSYGPERIAGWSGYDADAVDKAISRASAEIDGYLLSGGYPVPLSGPPENIKKYCIDIAAANLIIGVGVLESDPGGKAIVEDAKNARGYLGKVAEGKYKIPGYVEEGEISKPPAGGVRVSAAPRFDWRGY